MTKIHQFTTFTNYFW